MSESLRVLTGHPSRIPDGCRIPGPVRDSRNLAGLGKENQRGYGEGGAGGLDQFWNEL